MSSNLQKRIITAVLLIAALIPVVFLPGIVFGSVAMCGTIVALFEIFDVAKKTFKLQIQHFIIPLVLIIGIFIQYYLFPFNLLILVLMMTAVLFLSFVLDEKMNFNGLMYILFTMVYAGASYAALIRIRGISVFALIFVLLVVILTDTGAYFIGKQFGKHKLIPKLSPKKTVEGAIGGVLSAFVGASLYYFLILLLRVDATITMSLILIAVLMSVMAEFGDLFASKIKRFFNKKDFGTIFPGHGGVVDRVDGLIFAALTFYIITIVL